MSNRRTEILKEIRDGHIKSLDEGVEAELVQEVGTFIIHDVKLYKSKTIHIINNLKKKVVKGNFDKKLAVKGFTHVAKPGLKQYAKEFGLNIPRGLVGKTEIAIAGFLFHNYEEHINEFYDRFKEVYNQVNEENKRTIDRMLDGDEYEKIIEFVEGT